MKQYWNFSLLLLAASLPITAQFGIVCVADSGVPPMVRGEGMSELVGDLRLNCNGWYAHCNGGRGSHCYDHDFPEHEQHQSYCQHFRSRSMVRSAFGGGRTALEQQQPEYAFAPLRRDTHQ